MIDWDSLGFCDSYLIGEAHITASLPKKSPYCQYCIYISYHGPYDRHYCRITGEWILSYKRERGAKCPFHWKDKDGKEKPAVFDVK